MIEEERMMEVGLKGLVEAIHAAPTQAVLYFSGGASQVLTCLFFSVYFFIFYFYQQPGFIVKSDIFIYNNINNTTIAETDCN